MCTSASPVRIGTTRPLWSRPERGVTSKPVAADSHGKRAPSRPSAARRGERGRQAVEPVLEHRPGRRRLGRGEEREHEEVGVPEHVSAVRVAASCPRAPTAASPCSATDAIRWKSASRTSSWSSLVALDARCRRAPTAAPTRDGARRATRRTRRHARRRELSDCAIGLGAVGRSATYAATRSSRVAVTLPATRPR